MTQAIDSSGLIRELQTCLRQIFREDGSPPLQITGVYDDPTRQAVARVQQQAGLPADGELNFASWEAVSRACRRANARFAAPVLLDLFPSADFLLSRGASGNLVLGMQLLLRFLSEKYRNIPAAEQTGSFGPATEQAVQALQRKAGLPVTGVINAETWNRMALLYNFVSKVRFDAQVHEGEV